MALLEKNTLLENEEYDMLYHIYGIYDLDDWLLTIPKNPYIYDEELCSVPNWLYKKFLYKRLKEYIYHNDENIINIIRNLKNVKNVTITSFNEICILIYEDKKEVIKILELFGYSYTFGPYDDSPIIIATLKTPKEIHITNNFGYCVLENIDSYIETDLIYNKYFKEIIPNNRKKGCHLDAKTYIWLFDDDKEAIEHLSNIAKSMNINNCSIVKVCLNNVTTFSYDDNTNLVFTLEKINILTSYEGT